jgi:hypothetical protein
MLKINRLLNISLFTIALSLFSSPSIAQSNMEEQVGSTQSSSDLKVGFGGGLGYESIRNTSGIGINGNIKADFSNFRASVELIDLFFTFSKNSNGYYADTFSNGQSRCRNSANGQFAKNYNCSPNVNVDVGFLRDADLSYGFSINSSENKLFLGAGTSITDNRGVYGVIGYGNFLKAKIGSDRLDIRVGW